MNSRKLQTCAIVVAVACASCKDNRYYRQDNLSILPPVNQEIGPGGVVSFNSYNDGGTKAIKVTDARGKVFEIYFDHRAGYQTNWGAIYINGYPDGTDSIRVTDPARFKAQILKDIKFPPGF